jgi:uncharacterized protein
MAAEILIVDGYNIIFAWPNLKELADVSLDIARMKLADILSNYQGYKKNEVILVFDAYKVKENPGKIEHYHNIDIIYTRETQTADSFIEALSYQKALDFTLRVATSDGLEQTVILTNGAVRMSARELYKDVSDTEKQISLAAKEAVSRNRRRTLMDILPPETAKVMGEMRLKADEEESDKKKHKKA